MGNIQKYLSKLFYSEKLYWLNIFLVSSNFLLIASISFDPHLKSTLVYSIVKLIFIFYIFETIARFLITGRKFFLSIEHTYTAFVLILALLLRRPEVTILFTFRLINFMRHLNLIPKTRNLLDALLGVMPGLINL